MAKIDVFGMGRPAWRAPVLRTFGELTISLQPLDAIDEMRAEQEYMRLTSFYCGPDAPMSVPAVGGEPIEVSERLSEVVSRVWAMQVPSDDAYSSEELIALAAVMPDEWREMAAWAAEMDEAAHAKKAPEGGGITLSAAPSDSVADTPSPSFKG